MNTEQNIPAERRKHHIILPFVKLFLLLLLAAFWAYYCTSCMRQNSVGGTARKSSGSGGGTGNGAAESGNGPGAGESGSNSGKKQVKESPASAGGGTKADQAGKGGTQSNQQNSTVQGSSTKKSAVSAQPRQVESLSRAARAPEIQSGNGGSITGRKGFYGVATAQSTRAIFIVDTSGSMGATSRELPGKTRVDVLKMELKKSIFNSEHKTVGGFVILSFNSSVKSFPEKNICRYRNSKAMKAARDFIESLTSGGGTMMCTAWQKALDIAKEEKIDTVYFMTDGVPGDSFNDQWLLEELKQHRLTKLKIHCISVGMDQQFMKNIADHTHGKYIFIP